MIHTERSWISCKRSRKLLRNEDKGMEYLNQFQKIESIAIEKSREFYVSLSKRRRISGNIQKIIQKSKSVLRKIYHSSQHYKLQYGQNKTSNIKKSNLSGKGEPQSFHC